jgi:hypothetical protein
MKFWAPITLLLGVACSGSTPMTQQQIASEMTQLRALESESELFWKIGRSGHLPLRFGRAHAAYLQRAATEHEHKFDTASPVPGAEREFAEARATATSLVQRIIAMRLQIR